MDLKCARIGKIDNYVEDQNLTASKYPAVESSSSLAKTSFPDLLSHDTMSDRKVQLPSLHRENKGVENLL